MAHPQPNYGSRTPQGLVQEFTNHVHKRNSIIPHWRVAVATDREEATVGVIQNQAVEGWYFHESENAELLASAFSRMVAAGFEPDQDVHTCGSCLHIYYSPPWASSKAA